MELDELKAKIAEQDETIEIAWGIIANVSNGDWGQQSQEWQNAAISWRDGRYIGEKVADSKAG